MPNSLLSAPTLSGTMDFSSRYNVMNVGLTDTLLLLGHADAQIMYQPYQVLSAKQAVQFLNSDSKSPLLRAFLEAYNAGCKDIWLYPVAPMSEYEPTVSQRNLTLERYNNKTFYELYYDRLASAYSILADYDFAEIVVPVEAVFRDSGNTDFLTQLINFCDNSFDFESGTGVACLGIIGTRFSTGLTQSLIDGMVNDSRLSHISDAGKFVMIAAGEGTISVPQMSTTYISSVAVAVAATIATSQLDRSICGLLLPNVSSLVGNDITSIQLERLAQAKINLAIRTTRGRRGYAYQVRLNTDNTLAENDNSLWSMASMHIAAHTINQIREFGYAYIGFNGRWGPDRFKQDVKSYLNSLVSNGYIRDYTLGMMDEDKGQRVSVNVSIIPIFGVREITFKIEVGPGV